MWLEGMCGCDPPYLFRAAEDLSESIEDAVGRVEEEHLVLVQVSS